MQRILFVELLGGLGDVLIALPSMQALGRAYPQAKLTVLTFTPGSELIQHDPLIHEVIGLHAKQNHAPHAARDAVAALLNRTHFNVIVSDTNYDDIDTLIQQSRAAKVVTNLWRSPSPHQRVGDRFLQILQAEGLITAKDIAPAQLHLLPAEQLQVQQRLGAVKQPVIVLYPDAGMAIKRWSTANFVCVGQALQQQYNTTIVVPTGSDPGQSAQIAREIGGTASVWAPGTLRELAALMAIAALVIASDTGPARIAAALQTPTITLFGPSWHGRYGQPAPHINLQGYPDCPERDVSNFTTQRCWYSGECPFDRWQTCLEDISPAQVLAAAAPCLRRFPRKNGSFSRGQVLPESLPPVDHVSAKPAPTGLLFARNLLSPANSNRNLRPFDRKTSSLELAHLTPELARPMADLARPTIEIAHPMAEFSQATSALRTPRLELSQPTSKLTQPTPEPSHPIAELTQPTPELSQPISESSQAIPEPSQLISELAHPISDLSQPISAPSQPTSELAQPISELSQPISKSSQPDFQDEQATSVLQQPSLELGISPSSLPTPDSPLLTPHSPHPNPHTPIPTPQWSSSRNILILRLDNIGDVLMTSPALRAIKDALPDARLTLMASPGGSQAAALLPWVDEVLTCRALWQDFGKLAFDPDREAAFIQTLRDRQFDAAVIFTSFSQTPHPAGFMCYLAGIPLRLGQSKEWGGSVLTTEVKAGLDTLHQVERNLRLIEAVGFPVSDRSLRIQIPTAAQHSATAKLQEQGLKAYEPYILLNPWTSCQARNYPTERFAIAAQKLAQQTGYRIVVTGVTSDRAHSSSLLERLGTSAIDLIGQTSLAELAALIDRATLMLSNNTSTMHLADATRTPSVILFAGTEYECQWQPRHTAARLLRQPTACSPCYAFTCPFNLECLDIAPEQVVEAGLALLQTPSSHSIAR